MTRLTARSGLALMLALGALAVTGCKPVKDRLRDTLVDGFQTEPSWAASLCAYDAQALTNVTVTAVTNSGSSSTGSGTASVTGTPIMMAGMAAPGGCAGTIAFTYSTVRTGTRVTYSRRGARRSNSYALQINGITVTSRTGAGAPGAGAPGMAAPGAMPGAMPAGMQMPGAMGAGGCAAYSRCCQALTATPGFEGMAGGCAQIPQLAALGAQGESACGQALMGIRQSLGAMGTVPPGCQ
ncbi:MAG: hypothetical protein WCJ30_00565 [Deltaproteobacteria bacterium]